jgi:hypothetical protein
MYRHDSLFFNRISISGGWATIIRMTTSGAPAKHLTPPTAASGDAHDPRG